MSDQVERMCVFLPCGSDRRWAVPQNCLAEILTLAAREEPPPATVSWRGAEVPVMDVGAGGTLPWCDADSGTGLIAVILGVRGGGADYWGVALRGPGIAVRNLDPTECEDEPAAADEYSLAAFALEGQIYQVPDLPALQGLVPRP